MSYKIEFEAHPSMEDIQVLGDGIIEYARIKKNQPPIEFFGFFARDENRKILGGCSGSIYYGCFYIDYLWVHESLRGKKIGTQLMHAAEELARKKNCLFSTVNTMDWEALNFYKKFGYEVEHKREGYLNNSTFYFLKKDLKK